jgi:hypothetical protein
LSRLRCSKGGFGLWLGDKGIVNGKASTHISYFNTIWAKKGEDYNLKHSLVSSLNGLCTSPNNLVSGYILLGLLF